MTILKIGYDAQAFLSANGGLGKGLQLRNLLGRRIEEFAAFASTVPNPSGMKLIQEGASRHGIWQQVSLPNSLRRHGIDVFLAPQNIAPFYLPSSVHLILVLHDTILLQPFERFHLRSAFRRHQVRASVLRAEIVLTVSEYSRREILRAFPGVNVHVIPCTIGEQWFHAEPVETRQPFLLMVTSPAPHKNAAGGLAGYAHYARSAQKKALPLKVIGMGNEEAHTQRLVSQLGIDSPISFLPYLPEARLRDLYRQATAVIIPSFAEGFGIPLLEAMATGTPVLTSNMTSLPEVGAKAPYYFTPSKPAEIGAAIATVTTDDVLRKKMSALGIERAWNFHPSKVDPLVDAFWRDLPGAITRS